MGVLVRRAGRRDLDAIQSLWVALREQQAGLEPRLTPTKTAARLVREHREVVLADPRTGFFVAEEKSEIIGFLHAQIESNDPVYQPPRFGVVVDLFVREERRGAGIGSELLGYCKEWFRSHGLIEYRVVAPVQSADAHRFLEREGAVPLNITRTAPL